MNIFIIHSAYGSPDENWIPWLKKELEKLNCKVLVPRFPTPENQTLKNWMEVFSAYEMNFGKNSILVGHSLGSAFILRILEKTDKPIRASFLVSGFASFLDNPNFDKINKTFLDKPFDWQKIRQNCKRFYVFHSDNDPYVPLEKAEGLAGNLNIRPIIVKNAGHFNKASGYIKFTSLLGKIKKECTFLQKPNR